MIHGAVASQEFHFVTGQKLQVTDNALPRQELPGGPGLLPRQELLLGRLVENGALVEKQVSAALLAFEQAEAQADLRVEDVLPFVKVPLRPGKYAYYRTPGEPKPQVIHADRVRKDRRASVDERVEKFAQVEVEQRGRAGTG